MARSVSDWQGGVHQRQDGAFTHARPVPPTERHLFRAPRNSQSNRRLVSSADRRKSAPGALADSPREADRLTAGETVSARADLRSVSRRSTCRACRPRRGSNVEMPVNSRAHRQFRKAKVIPPLRRASCFVQPEQTAQLLPALLNCVVTVKKNGVSNAAEFACRPAHKPAAVAAAPPQNAPPSKPGRAVAQSGTVFACISSNGHIVTNQHVIEGCVGDHLGQSSGEAPQAAGGLQRWTNDLRCCRRRARSRRSR